MHMRKLQTSRIKRFIATYAILFGFLATFLVLGADARAQDCALTNPATCSYVGIGQTVMVMPKAFQANPACLQVANNSCPLPIMVPTASQAEWTSFINKHETCASTADCNGYNWAIGGWGACSTTCGGGTQTQTVTCQKTDLNTGAVTTVANSFCSGTPPASTQSCNTQSCLPSAPPNVVLVANPTTITIGTSSLLTWTVSGPAASSCVASSDNDPAFTGAISVNGGTQTVSPTVTTTYTVTCTNSFGPSVATATVTVNGAPCSVAEFLLLNQVTQDVSSGTIPYGQSEFVPDVQVSFDWEGTIIPPSTQVSNNLAYETINPGHIYQFTCDGAGCGMSFNRTDPNTGKSGMVVSCGPLSDLPPTVTLTANPTSITAGGSSTLTWVVSGASISSCTASSDNDPAFTGSLSTTGGGRNVSPAQTTNYTVTCANSSGSAASSATVTVSQPTQNCTWQSGNDAYGRYCQHSSPNPALPAVGSSCTAAQAASLSFVPSLIDQTPVCTLPWIAIHLVDEPGVFCICQ